eukprot:m.167819 g.167819  ORF g.167819 m.167819 type:complete len:1096 (+) comp17202_c1_seq2:150-3437(+)
MRLQREKRKNTRTQEHNKPTTTTANIFLQEIMQLCATVVVLLLIGNLGIRHDQAVLGADVQVVVDLPVHLADLARRVEETLQCVVEHRVGTQSHAQAVDGVHHGVDHVRRRLKDVGPHVVEQVREGVLASKAKDAEGHVLDGGAGRLAVHQVAVHQGVLQQWGDGVDVVLAHLADVFEHEGERLEHAVLHVELRHAVLVHERRQNSEGRARLGHNGNGDGGADTVLPLLHLEVVQQRGKHILRADRLGNVAKGVDGRAADGLLVRLQQVQQLKADAHPLARRDKLCAAIRDAADEVDAVLLDFLVAVAQDRGQAREEVLDRWLHLAHAHDVDDGLEGAQDAAEHLRVLLAQVFVQDGAHVVEELLLLALHHDDGDAGDEVGGLLADLGVLVVEAPEDGAADLREVGLGPRVEGVDDSAKAVEHSRVVARLLLEGVEDAVDQALLQLLVNVGRTQVGDNEVGGLDDHLAVGLALVGEALDNVADHLRAADLVGQLDRRVDQLAVVAAVEGHAHNPEVLEEARQDVLADVGRLDAVGRAALQDNLEHNLLHLLVGRLKLADERRHDLLGVVAGVLRVHQRDDVADGLEEGRQRLAAVLADALPQRHQHAVKGLDAVRGGGLGQRGNRERRHRAHLLLLVGQAVLQNADQALQVRQDGAAHEDGNLLHNLDARVAGLPRLLAAADGLEEGQEGRDAQGRGHDSKGARRRVAHILVDVVNVRPHGGDHGGEAGGLGQVGDDLAALDAGIVVLVDEERLDDDEDLVHVGPHQVVQLVEDAVDDLDQQVALLVLERRRHEQGQDLVEERAGAKLAGVVGDLAQSRLAHGRRAVLDLQQEQHDGALAQGVGVERALVHLDQQLAEVLLVLWLERRQVLHRLADVHAVLALVHHLLWDAEACAGLRRRRGHQPARGRADRHVVGRRVQDLVALGREHGVQLRVGQRPVALKELLLKAHVPHLVGRHAGQIRRAAVCRRRHAHRVHAHGRGSGKRRRLRPHPGIAHRRLVPARPPLACRRRLAAIAAFAPLALAGWRLVPAVALLCRRGCRLLVVPPTGGQSCCGRRRRGCACACSCSITVAGRMVCRASLAAVVPPPLLLGLR